MNHNKNSRSPVWRLSQTHDEVGRDRRIEQLDSSAGRPGFGFIERRRNQSGHPVRSTAIRLLLPPGEAGRRTGSDETTAKDDNQRAKLASAHCPSRLA
jgi:hypothetical protein